MTEQVSISVADAVTSDDDGLVLTSEVDQQEFGLIDVFGLAVLGFLPIALVPGFFFPSHVRQVLLIASLPLGAWLLGRLALIQRDRSAFAAVAFLGVALLSALRSEYRFVALLGTTSTELSMLALIAAFGWWATGRHLSARAIRLLPIILTVTAGVNGIVGIYQLSVNPSTGLYQAFGGRLSGLMSNPVFFAATFVGVWVFWSVRAVRSGSWRHLALTTALAASVALTGSRGATAVGLLFGIVALVARRNGRAVRSALASVAGVGVGFAVLAAFSPAQPDRLANANSSAGLRLRLEVWKAAVDALGERPLLGWGPGPYLHRLNTALPDSVYRDFDRLSWLDPHNVVLLVLVTTGVIGFGVLACFVAFAVRGQVDVALLAASMAMVLSWMLQPVVLTTWPIAFALLGAAVRPSVPESSGSIGSSRAVPSALIAIGVVVGLLYAGWSVNFRHVAIDRDPDRIDASASWMIHDPEVALVVARFHKNADTSGTELDRHLSRAEELAARTVEQTNTPQSWRLLTEVQVLRGDLSEAQLTAREWAEEWPHDPVAHMHVGITARAVGDLDAEADALQRVCEITERCDAAPPDG